MSFPRTVLITGADGFIGTSFLRRLQTASDVIAIPLTLDGGYDLSRCGWTKRIPADRADAIVYLAQSLRYREFPDGAADMFAVNVSAVVELLEWARGHGVQRFLLASTANVYAPAREAIAEDWPCAPTSFYAATRLSAEWLASPYASFFQIVRMRFFTIYGPGQKNMLIPTLIRRIKAGEPIQLAGGVGLYLTPLYVDDAVRAIEGLLQADLADRDACFNVCGDETVTLADIVDRLGRLLNRTPCIEVTEGTPTWLAGINRKLRHTLAWSPTIPLSEGLYRTFLAFEEELT